MRVLTVVLALAALPFAAGLAQGTDPYSDPKNCGAHLNFSDRAATRRADAALPHGGKHGVMDLPCGSSQPAPACEVSSTVAGPSSIAGKVKDAATGVGLANWCIHLFTESGTAVAKTGTNSSGDYLFPSLPDATYLICEVPQSGWVQTFPPALFFGSVFGVPCPTDPTGAWLGHSFFTWGAVSNIDFKNMKL